jgi:hypothetical protein
MNAATVKIKMLRGSLQCFIFGLLGLIPGLGLPFAITALVISGQVRASEKIFWNAGRPYRLWGIACASLGTILWGIIGIIVVTNFIYYRNDN